MSSSAKASPSRGDTIDSPSSDEDNHPVAPTTTDSPLNKISKAKGEQRKRKEKGMGMVGKILRMAHLQSILKNGHAPKKGKKGKNESDNVQSKGNHGDVEITEEVTSEKLINAHVSTSRLPLVLSEKVQRSKALVECEGESILI
ncbi:hypothetical protein NC651_033054 [Populus alba x Populus x berolinensis]|nr:hypothetical protein NC651_033054 [Populus alba x Populus x berolinensis]